MICEFVVFGDKNLKFTGFRDHLKSEPPVYFYVAVYIDAKNMQYRKTSLNGKAKQQYGG